MLATCVLRMLCCAVMCLQVGDKIDYIKVVSGGENLVNA